MFGRFRGEHGDHLRDPIKRDILGICKFVWHMHIFSWFLGFKLSNGVAKSKINSHSRRLNGTMGRRHGVEILKIKISMKSRRSGSLSGSGSLRGPRWREFHCLAASRLY